MNKHPLALCDECTLLDAKYVPIYKPKIQQYRIMFIGQAPGETEAVTHVPFTGSAGKAHWSILKSVGINKQNCIHDNVCSCFPGKDPRGGDIKPTLKEMMCCFPRLKNEIQLCKPKLIIALGEQAMFTLTRLSGITQNRGRIVDLVESFEYDCKVLVALHPSYVMRQRQWLPIQANTYDLINKFFNDEIVEDEQPELILDPTAEELEKYLDVTTPVGCDTETTGLNPRSDTIIGFSFSTSVKHAVSVAFYGATDPRWRVIKKFIEDPTKMKIWQNGSYDTSMLRYSNTNPMKMEDRGFYYDTRLAQQLLDSDLPTDLDYLRAEYTTIKPYKPSKKERGRISEWGKERMLTYAALDAVATLTVHDQQVKKLTPQELQLMEELLIPLVYAIGRMEDRGVKVSVEKIASLYAAAAPFLAETEQKFSELGINPRSPKQLKEYFGFKKSNEAMLEYHIKRNHPQRELMEQLLEYRSYHKMVSTYLKGVYKRLEDGRIHTHFKIEGTGTGRLSSEDPNLQNVPTEMRVIYEADDDYVLVKGDHSQIELWVGAIVADEQQMIKDLQDGVDIHYVSCQLCFPQIPLKYGNREQDFIKQQVMPAKAVVFGTFYGRTPYSIAREFGVPVSTAEQWQLALLNKYPGLAKYRRRCENEVNKNGYLTTPFGRRRYIASITQGYNFPVQSSASDITLGSIVAADAVGLEPIISVHDDIVFRVKKKSFKQSFATIRKVMERRVPQLQNTSFKIDYQQGPNWYELEKIKLKD